MDMNLQPSEPRIQTLRACLSDTSSGSSLVVCSSMEFEVEGWLGGCDGGNMLGGCHTHVPSRRWQTAMYLHHFVFPPYRPAFLFCFYLYVHFPSSIRFGWPSRKPFFSHSQSLSLKHSRVAHAIHQRWEIFVLKIKMEGFSLRDWPLAAKERTTTEILVVLLTSVESFPWKPGERDPGVKKV